MAITKLLATLAVAIALVGCAHPMVITPNLAGIERPDTARPVKKNVAYYISDTLRQTEVTTGGGGGDKVSYFPYRDMELSLYKMLSNVFGEVTTLKSPADQEAMARHQIVYVVTPQLSTSSSSDSAFTWPPTRFNVDLTCNISDASGKEIVSKKVVGVGEGEFSEFKKDHAITGKRALTDAMLKMQQALLDEPILRN
ncbi:hypothetical protein [Janthinobacterium sp. ZB1P44]|uniref:hypothetical protein n=1 Tax=Janthinobacterium sp. ZB1P44 TaxID=3424192 RepID=UPI003F1E6190